MWEDESLVRQMAPTIPSNNRFGKAVVLDAVHVRTYKVLLENVQTPTKIEILLKCLETFKVTDRRASIPNSPGSC